MTLADAHLALEKEDRRAALVQLLDAWRISRSPAVAEIIDVVSVDMTRALPKIEGNTRGEFQSAWLEVASRNDPADMGRLLGVLDREPCTLMRDRIDRLALRPDDPRLSHALSAFISRTPCPCTSTPNAPMWTQIFKIITALKDVRVRPALEAHAAKKRAGAFSATLYARSKKALEGLTSPPALSRHETRLLEQISKKVDILAGAAPKGGLKPMLASRADLTQASLLARVYEAPEDDAPRLVYADYLTEREDSRGELIMLQCKKTHTPLTAAEAKREKALVREHARKALGAIEPAIGKNDLVYERGFVAACELQFKSEVQRKQLLRNPAWATVRCLRAPEAAMLLPASSSTLRALRELDGVGLELLRELGSGLPAITSVRFVLGDREKLFFDLVGAAFPSLVKAKVSVLGEASLQLSRYRWLVDGAWPASVDYIEIAVFSRYDEPHRLAPWLAVVPARVKTFVFDFIVDWRFTATREGPHGWRVTAEPLASFADPSVLKPITQGLEDAVTVLEYR